MIRPVHPARAIGAALLLCAAAMPALAQTAYPSRPVRMAVGYSAGGPADALARTIAPRLGTVMGQSVVVENRPGADGNIAAEAVARAAPDGYTVLLDSSGIAMNATLYSKLGYNATTDLAPISLLGGSPLLVVVHPSVPVQTLGELLALAKARKGQLLYGSTSAPTYLATVMFNTMAGIDMVRVPYKGAGAAIPGMLAGDVQVMLSSIGPLLPHVKSGRLRALAVTSPKRTPLAPEMPTVDEAGLPGYSAATWYALFVPARTPRAIIDRINADLRKVLAMPEVRDSLALQSVEPISSTPEELADYLRTEIAKWGKVIRDTNSQMN